jgi:hypothetical protein
MKKLTFGLVLAGICLHLQVVVGWSAEGHRAVALIAEQQLKQMNALGKVNAILQGVTLVQIATCADEIRDFEKDHRNVLSSACKTVFPAPATITGTSRWHFVNIPFPSVNPATDVNKACSSECVLTKIRNFGAVLSDKNAKAFEKRQAISWLVHFIGDVHQPLHAIVRNNDSGGNDEQVSFNHEQMSLHHLWDESLVARIKTNPSALVTELAKDITTEASAEKNKKTTPTEWAVQSFGFAHDLAYDKIPAANGLNVVATISDMYVANATPKVRQQIARAGVRLALFLNDQIK